MKLRPCHAMNDSAGGTASGCAATCKPGTLKNYRKHGALPHTPGEGLHFSSWATWLGGSRCDGSGGAASPTGVGGRSPTLGSRQQAAARSAGGVSFTPPPAKPRGGSVICFGKARQRHQGAGCAAQDLNILNILLTPGGCATFRAGVPRYRAGVPRYRAGVPRYWAVVPRYRAGVPRFRRRQPVFS